jgi:hypothetical protein
MPGLRAKMAFVCPIRSAEPSPGMLYWVDGTPSGFSIDNLSESGPEITVDLVTPLDPLE